MDRGGGRRARVKGDVLLNVKGDGIGTKGPGVVSGTKRESEESDSGRDSEKDPYGMTDVPHPGNTRDNCLLL